MTDDVTDATVETTEDETDDVEETQEQTDEETLGEPGKKALAAERAAARAAKKEARDAKAELAALKSQIAAKEKSPDEQELDQVRREAALEASQKANARIVQSEVRAAATGKLADPADAVLFLDMNEFEVAEDGSVDAQAIQDAISDLLTRKPHLAAGKEKRFGNVNQSPKAPAQPGQLSLAEYNALSREERRKAREDGRVKNLIGAN